MTAMKKVATEVSKLPPALAKVPCPELRRLPKTPRARGVIFHKQTPGSPVKLIARGARGAFLDPGHPATRDVRMITWRSDLFGMTVAPKALLFRPDAVHYPFGTLFEKWEDKVQRVAAEASGESSLSAPEPVLRGSLKGKERARGDRDGDVDSEDVSSAKARVAERVVARFKDAVSKGVPMSISFANNKAKLGGKAFYKAQMKKRMREAITLIINKGAKVETRTVRKQDGSEEVQKKVVYDLEEVKMRKDQPGAGWVMSEWTYLIFLEMKLYRAPFSELIPQIRQALGEAYQRASKMDKGYLASEENKNRNKTPVRGGPRKTTMQKPWIRRKDESL